MIKQSVQTLLKHVGLYNRLKASCLYDLYWSVADGRILENRAREVSFYRNLLKGFRAGGLIFDIGANHGQKTDVFLRIGGRVVAVDPDELNQEALRGKFLKYRWSKKQVVVVGKAVSDRRAVHKMWIDEPGSAKNTLSQKWVETLRRDETRFGHCLSFAKHKDVESITLEDLIAVYGTPFFIKIDVEGYEPYVLGGLKTLVSYVSFEVNLPEFKQEGLACIDRLGELADGGQFNYAIDCKRGFELDRWLLWNRFREVFSTCSEPSIEVFWKSPQCLSSH